MTTLILLAATSVTAFIAGVVVEATRCTAVQGWLDNRRHARVRMLQEELRACQAGEEG